MSRYYWYLFVLETVCLRIGFSFPEPNTLRNMVSFLDFDDLVELLRCSLFTPRVGHTIAFGMSDNATTWWDNSKAGHLGYQPRRSSREFAHLFSDSAGYPADDDLARLYQGGPFITTGPIYD